MTWQQNFENFIFRGLLIHSTFEELEALGVRLENPSGEALRRSDDEIPLEDFSASIRTQAVKMASVYQAFFCFENAVRELVANRLAESLGKDWWAQGLTASIRKKVSERKRKEESNRWHLARGSSEISYADFGDLSLMITNNWHLFEDLFPDQDWVRTRLSDLELSRNIIAHNGVLNGREVTRITLYLKDWVMQVG